MHETGTHGGPPVKVVGALTAAAFVSGLSVLIGEGFDGEDEASDGHSPQHQETS